MNVDRYLKIVLTFVGLALWLITFKLWLSPQEVLAEDFDIDSRLSYISKIIGVIESSVIKIEGDLRYVKRQASISTTTRDLSKKQLKVLETKITAMERLVNSIEMDLAEMDGNIAYIESDVGSLSDGSCDNIFLCRQKKY